MCSVKGLRFHPQKRDTIVVSTNHDHVPLIVYSTFAAGLPRVPVRAGKRTVNDTLYGSFRSRLGLTMDQGMELTRSLAPLSIALG